MKWSGYLDLAQYLRPSVVTSLSHNWFGSAAPGWAQAVMIFALTSLWLLADTLVPQPFTYFSFRSVLVQYTGILAIGAMSIAMALSFRPRWIEPQLNGLDKMYRLHKWLGIAALVLSVIYWWWAQGTKWMVGWGWLARPERGSAVPHTLVGRRSSAH